MSFDKAIKAGKEHRHPYKGSRRFDRECRNHGGCLYCRLERTRFDWKARREAKADLKSFEKEGLTNGYFD